MIENNFKLPEQTLKDLENLKQELRNKGYMNEELSYGLKSLFMLLVLFIFSLFIMNLKLGFIGFILSSFILGMFYLRMGFFAHDMIHGQIVRGNLAKWVVYPIVSLGQGLSANWWRKKHGAHHHYPNAYKKEGEKVKTLDSDIDTLPLLCWDKNLLSEEQKQNKILMKWLKIQHIAFWPIVSTLRFAWIFSSFKEGNLFEKSFIIIHHVLMVVIGIVVLELSLTATLSWIILGSWIGGFIMGVFALISHSGLEIYEHNSKLDPYSSVLRTTRNLKYNPITFWLSGGLSHQIEHHLFSTLKRKHLLEASNKVREIMQKNSLPYQEISLLQGLNEINRTLKLNGGA